MNSNVTISFSQIKSSIGRFLYRFHVLLFTIVIIGGLVVVVLILYGIIIRSGEPGDYTPAASNTSFDQATIKKVEELKTRDQSDNLTLPSGRINPFVE